MTGNYLVVLIILILGAILSVVFRKLTAPAALTGVTLGFLIFLGAGYTGILMLGSFFVFGSAATSWKMGVKAGAGLAEKNKGRRKPGQVIANAGVAGLLGLFTYAFPAYAGLFRLMMAAAFAAATADTLSSELGNVYGRRFYNILSFKEDSRGLDGVVSLEGTTFGVAGSVIIAVIYACSFGWDAGFLWIILSGTLGNLADSVLGASLERRHYLGNNTVNFLNTLTGTMAAMFLQGLF